MRSTECPIDNVIRVYVVYIHVAVIMMHLSTKSRGNIILSGDIDIIQNSLWRPQSSWIIMIIEFGTFRRHGCLFLAFCTGFGSNISYSGKNPHLFPTFD